MAIHASLTEMTLNYMNSPSKLNLCTIKAKYCSILVSTYDRVPVRFMQDESLPKCQWSPHIALKSAV